MTIQIGDQAPAFSLPDQDEKMVDLNSILGSVSVLYFYPKDHTPGCTQQACDFRDHFDVLKKIGVSIYGISRDSSLIHKSFCDKLSLPYTLLVDKDSVMSQAYNVWGERSMYGKKYMGIERSTFLIDTDGVVRGLWRKVKVKGHVEDVVIAAKALLNSQ